MSNEVKNEALAVISEDQSMITLKRDNDEHITVPVDSVAVRERKPLKTKGCSTEELKFVSQRTLKEKYDLTGSEARRLHKSMRNVIGQMYAAAAAAATNGMIATKVRKKVKDGKVVSVSTTHEVKSEIPEKKGKAASIKTASDLVKHFKGLSKEEQAKSIAELGLSGS